MNYIKQLQADKSEAEIRLARWHEGVIILKQYLTSDKFYNDPTVQVSDILRRIGEVEDMVNSEVFQ